MTNFKGDTGPKGDKGVKGDHGHQGNQGTQGVMGERGAPGVYTPPPRTAKWRLLVPIVVLLATAGALGLIPRFRSVAGTDLQVAAKVVQETTEAPAAAPAIGGRRESYGEPPTAAMAPSTTEKRTTTFTLDMMKERQQYQVQRQQWIVQASFSMLMALASVFIILSKKYPEDCNKWAYSTIAFILGYWLKG